MNETNLGFWSNFWRKMVAPLNLTPEEQESSYQHIISHTRGDALYYVLLFFSVILATYGVISDNTAVTIGGMLIAPLYWPILGFSLGVSKGSATLMYRGVIAIVIGSLIAILLSYIITLFTPALELGTEFFLRTDPTLNDLFIALAAGFAGAYIRLHPKIANLISGVAIAVALMPPLATMGVALAQGSPAHFFGALLLLLTNLFAIIFAAIIVFRVAHLTNRRLQPEAAELRSRTIIFGAVAFILIVASLIGLTIKTIQERNSYLAAKTAITKILPDALIINLDSMRDKQNQLYEITVATAKTITADVIEEIKTIIIEQINRPVNLEITWLVAKQMNN